MYNHQTLKSEYPQHQEVLLFYKTTPCPSIQYEFESYKQSKRNCPQVPWYHYHTAQDMRRPVIDQEENCLLYHAEYCPSLQEGYECQDGMSCGYCHTQNELNYHPLYYKTQPCTNCMYPNNQKLCPNYHPEESNRNLLVEKIMMMGNYENSIHNEVKNKHNQFNLDMFKVKPCTKKGNHNVKICDYYHHDKDRRRPTTIFSYTPPICTYILRNMVCPNGDNCHYAHNKLEQLYHPERYKRKFCLHHPHNIHKCDYGGHCSFAHNESEILIELLHNMKQDENFYLNKYKTVFCPYIYEHDRTQCIYAHNPQDLRRDLAQHKYSAIQCPYWSPGQIFCYEEGGCPNQMDCPNCHGWKEQEYHPMLYKTKPCNNTKKCLKKECPFYHSNADRRQTQMSSQLTSSLTKSLLQNTTAKSFMPQQQQQHSLWTPFRMGSDPESNRKIDSKVPRQGAFSHVTTTTHASSMNYTEDDSTPSLSYKPRTQVNEFYPPGYHSPVKAASVSNDKSRLDLGRGLFSPPNDMWSPFQPDQDQDDQLENFFASSMKITKPSVLEKGGNSRDSEENNNKQKIEGFHGVEKSTEMSNEEFKEAFISHLDKKGLGHTKAYLINPMIDIKALKSFSKKDFHLFPHISNQDKEKIVKIIEDILEVEALLCPVNNILNNIEYPLSPDSDEGDFLKGIGSWERNQNMKGETGLRVGSYH